MNIFEDEELVNRGLIKLNNLRTKKMLIDDFIKLKHIESSKFNELIKLATQKHGKLSPEAKEEIIKEFKITIKQYDNETK